MNNDNLESYRMGYLYMNGNSISEFDNKMREDWHQDLPKEDKPEYSNRGILDQIDKAEKVKYDNLTYEQLVQFVNDTIYGYSALKEIEYELIDEC